MTFEYIKAPVEAFSQYFDASQTAGQDQIRSTGSKESIVESYTESFKLGEKMPAGTVSSTNMPVDFYHRGKAAIAAGIEYFILIRITTDIAPWQRSVIATLRNNLHGLRMTDPDTLQQALLCVEHGWTPEETARKFKIDVSTLRRALAIRSAEDRAKRLGVETKFSTLKRTTQSELASTGLNDAPFKGVVTLLSENPVGTAKAAEIIKAVKAETSDRRATERLKDIKGELAPKTLPTVAGTTPRAGATSTPKSAIKAFLDAYVPLKAVLQDQPTFDALLQATSTDPSYAKFRKALEDLHGPIGALVAKFLTSPVPWCG